MYIKSLHSHWKAFRAIWRRANVKPSAPTHKLKSRWDVYTKCQNSCNVLKSKIPSKLKWNAYALKRASWVSCHLYSKANQMHQCVKFILFWSDTMHVSDDCSVHHQEFKTVHTAVKQILLLACAMRQIYFILEWHSACFGRLFCPSSGVQDCTYSNICLTAVCTVLNSWWWTEQSSETCRVSLQNKINLTHWCIWLVLLYKQYYDARPYESKMSNFITLFS